MSGGLLLPGNAATTDVRSGKTFSAGPNYNQAGNMAEHDGLVVTPGTVNVTIPEGHHDGTGYVVGDTNLASSNIKKGTTIFNVAGSNTVVDTSDATATAAQILTGESAYVNGAKLAGSMVNNGALGTITPTTTNQSIAAGYTSGGTVAGDTNLQAGNIKTGVSIFGIAGSLVPGTPFASGSATSSGQSTSIPVYYQGNSASANQSGYAITVSGLSFTPSIVICLANTEQPPEWIIAQTKQTMHANLSTDPTVNTSLCRNLNNAQLEAWFFNSTLTSGGFTVYSANYNTAFTWYAFA